MKMSVSILGITMLVLSGCHHQPAAPNGGSTYSRGIVVSQARLVLPAVKGHPGAAYFTIGNENDAPTTLVQVEIAGVQSTEMHETSGGTMQSLPLVHVEPGQHVIFAPAGKHVMAFNLAPTLAPGRTGRIVMHFADGKSTSAPLRIEAAGGDMAGMDMGGKP